MAGEPKLLIPRMALVEIDEAAIKASRCTPAREVCGFLIGHAQRNHYRVSFGLTVNNSVKFNPGNRYQIDARTYTETERLLGLRSLQIVGIFHSHPGTHAEPSHLDRDYFFPGWVYLIVGLMPGGLMEHRAFEKRVSPTERIVEVGIQSANLEATV